MRPALSPDAQRYVDLLKNAVSFALWDEPGLPVAALDAFRPWHRRLAVRAVLAVANRFGWRVLKPPSGPESAREGRVWPLVGHSMIGRARLDNLQRCIEAVVAEGVPGDILEAGVWRGGAAIFARGLLLALGAADRRVFVADSFAGLPPPDPRYPVDAGDRHHAHDFLAVPLEAVRANFARYDLLDDRVVFLKGWFKDTLPRAPFEQLAVLRLDGDMYASTMDALDGAYDRLSPGGFCIVDDYALEGCRRAVDDFRRARGITEPIETIDWTGVYWRRA